MPAISTGIHDQKIEHNFRRDNYFQDILGVIKKCIVSMEIMFYLSYGSDLGL